jgi:CubicO group peptidase (beta-lactamase class C family)
MKKFQVFPLLALLVLLITIVANDQTAVLAARPSQEEPPLRLSEPTEAIVADLESYIPGYMREQSIPGVGIALIRDGEVVWTEGFGVANALTRRPVTPDTLFEVASNSKVVTAYIALRLVDEGLLSLDEPLNDYLPEPWLPPEYRDTITLRHVLSHSSGLGHGTTSRENLFAPGRGYSYSAVGFQYLQAVIEQVTGQSLEQVAQEMVYAPLGMSSSSFVNRAEFTPRTANGHVHGLLLAILFAVLYLASLAIVGFIGLVIVRIRTGRWRPDRRQVIGIQVIAYVLSVLPGFILFGLSSLMELAWLFALCGLILLLAYTLIFLAGRIIIARILSKRAKLRLILTILWSVLILVGLVFLSSKVPSVPVPKWLQTEVQAAGSMRATTDDMASFLIELSNPQHLNSEVAAQMRTSQVRLSGDLSWGLGPGIQHSQQGDALWQWGQHIDFQSVMIIYPEHGFGVVVCTNNDLLSPDVAVEIAHRALGGKIEPIRQAIHLEFNYGEGN